MTFDYIVHPVHQSQHSLLDKVLKISPDVVYWRFNKHGFRKTAAGLYQANIPLVFAVAHINDITAWAIKPHHGWKARLRSPWKRLKARIEHEGFRYVDILTVNNKDHLKFSPVPNPRYIPNGLTTEANPFLWKRAYCAWVSNIKPAKRPEAAVRLAEQLATRDIDVLMVGSIQSKHYRWLEDASQLPNNCHYLGHKSLEEVNGILAGSLMHIHTCQPEGFSNVFIQAWLQGRPSVSLGFDPSGYIGKHYIGLDAKDDESMFTQAVFRLLDDDKTREEMGQRAQKFAHETFSVELMVDRVKAVLTEAASCKK